MESNGIIKKLKGRITYVEDVVGARRLSTLELERCRRSRGKGSPEVLQHLLDGRRGGGPRGEGRGGASRGMRGGEAVAAAPVTLSRLMSLL